MRNSTEYTVLAHRLHFSQYPGAVPASAKCMAQERCPIPANQGGSCGLDAGTKAERKHGKSWDFASGLPVGMLRTCCAPVARPARIKILALLCTCLKVR